MYNYPGKTVSNLFCYGAICPQGGYSRFQVAGMIEWQQKSTPKKIPGQKLTPENSHAEFQYLYFDILILSNYRKCLGKSRFSKN